MVRIGVDTGGTFTDLVAQVEGQLRVLKIPSTPLQPAEAVIDGVRRIAAGAAGSTTRHLAGGPAQDAHSQLHGVDEVIHGTTVATNALLERRGGPTALVATAGFEDLLVLRRQARPALYALHPTLPPPLVPREWRLALDERALADGRVLRPIDEESLQRVVRAIEEGARAGAVRSVAVALLHAYASDVHERTVVARLESLGLPISRSSKVLPEHREYERTSTTVVDAYVAPVVGDYLARLGEALPALRVMQSSGTVAMAKTVAARPVGTILSGPAAGVVGARAVCARAGISRFISFDVGGTSTDVALVDRAPELSSEGEIAGLPVRVPALRVHTVGAGGGSIAWRDEGGALKVGPRSAGATPGPACYGLGGTAPTVTDAMLVLGRLEPTRPLAGGLLVHEAAARAAVGQVASALGLGIEAAAAGIVRVAVAITARAIRVISVERGHDPRDFALVAFGGAGGLLACEVAREVGMRRVLLPPAPGLLCAYGALAADVGRDYTATRLVAVSGSLPASSLAGELAPLEVRAHADLDAEGVPAGRRRLIARCELRYVGQSYELPVELPPDAPDFDLAAAFHALHHRRYGFSDPARPVERVALRLAALGLHEPPPPLRVAFEQGGARVADRAGAAVYVRERLRPGAQVEGPAVVVEYSGTTWVPVGWRGTVDEDGAIGLEWVG